MLAQLAALHPVHKVLLGCTHYPIVMDLFKSLAPEMEFIDPADLQAKAVIKLLKKADWQSNLIKNGSIENAEQAEGVLFDELVRPSLEIITSGTEEAYRTMLNKLGIPEARRIEHLI